MDTNDVSLRLPSVILLPWAIIILAAIFLATGTVIAQDALEVQVRIDTLRCISISEEPETPALGKNDTDEVYFTVMGPGHRFVLFPDEGNYYLSKAGLNLEKNGWIDKNKRERGTPVIWHGVCAENETVRILVDLWEQDLGEKMGPEAMSEHTKKLAIGRFGVDFERINKILKSKGEDPLGGFEVHVKNVKGKLVVRAGDHGDTKIKSASGGSRMDFVCKGLAGSVYRGTTSIVATSRRLALIRTFDVPASDGPWNEKLKVDLKGGTTYLIVPSPSSRYDLGRKSPPWNGYMDWYAGAGEIDGRPRIPHDKLRIGGLTILYRHDSSKEKKEEAFPIGPFQGFLEISSEHGGALLFCIVDRPGQYFDNSGVCQVHVYEVN